MEYASVDQIKLEGRNVVVRVDYNVPLRDGVVQDDRRIRATLPTLNHIMAQRPNRVVLLSHLGRPNGQAKPQYSLQPVAAKLNEIWEQQVQFVPACVGDEAVAAVKGKTGVFLLENLRFHAEEEGSHKGADGNKVKASAADVAAFRKTLSEYGDVFVSDAFGTAHRAHSSVVGVDLPVRCAGFLLKKELDYFGQALHQPKRPFLAILGGAKVSDKIQLIENLLDQVDELIIGGGMAFTFKKVLGGMAIAESLFDDAGAKLVPQLMGKAAANKVQIHLPIDFVAADKFDAKAATTVVTDAQGIPDQWMGLDAGPASRFLFRDVILRAKTLVWNGPLGVFEFEAFSSGTRSAMEAVAEATANGTVTIIGGGDTASAAEQFGFASKVSHVSTGGGASLELLEGKTLPGLAALTAAKDVPDAMKLE